ncbi:MAG: DUF1800 domain-containing protein [Cyanobacteria bacterium J06629_9]
MNSDRATTHLLNRLSLGIRPGDLQRLQQTGPSAYLQAQLYPAGLAEPPQLTQALGRLTTVKMSPIERSEYISADNLSEEASQQRLQQIDRETVYARLLRAIYSPKALQEVMVNFWFNHFNLFADMTRVRLWLGDYEETAIRPHALGNFRDLLGATANHPAMLVYLDNWRNAAPGRPGSRGRFSGLNENYARELMELHTLGVNGGYTQADVVALARIFTGWTIAEQRQQSRDGRGFQFRQDRHDTGTKQFLGQTIAASGKDEGERALDILASHRSTAWHISYKLVQYFVADRPRERLVKRVARRFHQSDGHIPTVLQALFESDDFQTSEGAKFRTPYEYLMAVMRAMSPAQLPNDELHAVAGQLDEMGMKLYGNPSPDGYANIRSAWLNPDAMMRRISGAIALHLRHPAPHPTADQLLATLGPSISDTTHQAIRRGPADRQAPMVLGSPDMMYR